MLSRFHNFCMLTGASLLLFVAAAVAQQPPEFPVLPDGLSTVEFYSPAVERTMKYDIVLPEDYENSDRDYPVLYLLHGFMQNYTVWGRNLNAAYYARQLNDLIVVMPDAGNSWYINHGSNEDGQANNWEDHIIEDVIGHVDTTFRTVARREGRAIAGLSMGGYGAVMLGLRHPQLFASIGSSSGALGYARGRARALAEGRQQQVVARSPQEMARMAEAEAVIAGIIAIPRFSTQEERTPRSTDFIDADQALEHDPFHILYTVPKSQLPHIYLDSGTEDSLMNVTREFMQILLVNNVPFDFMQSQGRHNAEYWRRSVGHMMSVQHEVMQRSLGNRP